MAEKIKSAVELAMEKYGIDKNKGDSLSEGQKEEINEIRSLYRAKKAEREILYKDELNKLRNQSPNEYHALREKAEQEYIYDRKRLENEEKKKIDAVRAAKS